MDFKTSSEIAKINVCAVCGADLVVIRDQATLDMVIRCGRDKSHVGYVEPPGKEQAVRRGEMPAGSQPEDRRPQERAVELRGPELERALTTDFSTGEVLQPARVQMLIAYAAEARLNVKLGHVMIYQGAPRVTVDGYHYAARLGGRSVRVATRPLREEEYTPYKIAEQDYAWIAWDADRDEAHSETGLGIVTLQEINEMSAKNPGKHRSPVVGAHPQRMAQKRAEWQFLRKRVPLGLPEEAQP